MNPFLTPYCQGSFDDQEQRDEDHRNPRNARNGGRNGGPRCHQSLRGCSKDEEKQAEQDLEHESEKCELLPDGPFTVRVNELRQECEKEQQPFGVEDCDADPSTEEDASTQMTRTLVSVESKRRRTSQQLDPEIQQIRAADNGHRIHDPGVRRRHRREPTGNDQSDQKIAEAKPQYWSDYTTVTRTRSQDERPVGAWNDDQREGDGNKRDNNLDMHDGLTLHSEGGSLVETGCVPPIAGAQPGATVHAQ